MLWKKNSLLKEIISPSPSPHPRAPPSDLLSESRQTTFDTRIISIESVPILILKCCKYHTSVSEGTLFSYKSAFFHIIVNDVLFSDENVISKATHTLLELA